MSEPLEAEGQSVPADDWYLYMVRCRNGTLYTGITTDVERRLVEHQEGGPRAARYLRGKGPLELVYTMGAGDRAQASALEYRVKSLTRADKQSLIAGVLKLGALELGPLDSGRTTKTTMEGTET